MKQIEHWYLHVDLDAFFASVEQLDNPEYRGKPLIVGGKPEDRRSVVSTASYEARKFGVHSAMPTYQAYKLCPHGIFVYGRMQRYAELSYQIMNIFRNYSPDVDQMSIDEAFIDITGTEKLFGPPLEVAKKIKAEVKQNTGLTVSVGIAPTKYLAKIASGYQKPDGITLINQGDESSFMLSLPLEKLWGLGPKSLELLRSKGIKKTQDIYELPLDTLTFLFGNNMGNYLYDVVRGNEKETFKRETKNHSISAEKTFPYDLTDIYTIETEILEIAHGVFFRLLKHNGFSRTAFIKIRYDDFSTCSAQVTLERNIITLDTFYETVKNLFEKKYEKGRAIRLLGVGFEKIENEEKPYQQDLFTNNDEKKQAVEKAILTLEKKHPEIKVRKARTIKNLLIVGLLLSLPFNAKSQNIDNSTKQKGAGTTLPDTLYIPPISNINTTNSEQTTTTETILDLSTQSIDSTTADTSTNEAIESSKDNLFEYNIEGYYQAEFTTGFISSFGNNSTFVLSGVPPVFKQEVELTASLIYKKHWFFNVDFADKFEKNTLSIGYKEGNYLKEAKISNRNIVFPSGYSAEIFGYSPKGGEHQSPGVSLNFASPVNKWAADFMLRYDLTQSRSAVFYGLNKVSEIQIAPESFVYGQSFTFPNSSSSALQEVNNIFIEDIKGSFRDKNGKIYRQLSITEYTILPEKNKILISSTAGGNKKNNKVPTILITFRDSSPISTIITNTGDYTDSQTFAGQIQSIFGESINLSDYSYELLSEIENSPALVIQNSIGFSPYVDLNIYDFGLSESGDLLVTSKSSGTIYKEFQIASWIDSYNSFYEDFFQEKHFYSQVVNINNASSRYPFCSISPNIYLTQNTASLSSDIVITKRTFSPVSELTIGSNVSTGSVQVFVNGILDNNATYNSEKGSIILSSPPANTDKIYIIWQEEGKNYTDGAITTAAGYKINYTDNFSSDISLTAYLPINAFINQNQFSTIDKLQPSYGSLSGGFQYLTDNLKLIDKSSFAISKENASNILLVSSQNNTSISTCYLSSNSGYFTNAEPSLNIIDPLLHSISHKSLSKENDCTIQNHLGIKDIAISGSAIPLYWDFEKSINPSEAWAAVDIKLNEGDLLKESSYFELAIKSSIPEDQFEDYDFYLQLGINASSSFTGEDTTVIPTWKLEIENIKNSWQKVKIYLNDEQRAKLISNTDARLIVCQTNGKTETNKGLIFIGPYQPHLQSIYTKVPDELSVSLSTSITYYNLNKYASFIDWKIPSDIDLTTIDLSTITNPFIYAKRHFKSADFSNYELITFEYNSSEITEFSLQLKDCTKENNSCALKFTLKNAEPYNNENQYFHTISINTKNNNVFIDNIPLSQSDFELYIAPNVIPNTQEIIIPITQKGTFNIGNLCYQNSKLNISAKNYSLIEYEKKFEQIQINASISSTQSIGDLQNPKFSAVSTAKTSFTSEYASLKADTTFQNISLVNAGHTIKTENPILSVISISEDYRYSLSEKSLSKKNDFALDFSKILVPIKLNFQTIGQDLNTSQNQKSAFETKVNLISDDNKFDFLVNSSWSQKINTLVNTENNLLKDNYFIGWKEISKLEFSIGENKAFERKEDYSAKLSTYISKLSFSPSISYSLSGSYINNFERKYYDKEQILLSLPFIINKNSITLNLLRNGSGETQLLTDGSYITDTEKLFNIQKERTLFYESIPFYELFNSSVKNLYNENYSTKYEIIYKRKLFNSFNDIYIPSSASFAIIRDIKSITNTNNHSKDLFQYKTVITNTSINNFGTDSIKKIFKWFKQEEIISSVTGIVKVPTEAPNKTSYQVTTYIQSMFMISDNNNITVALDGSLETNLAWTTHGTIIHSRNSKISLIKSLTQFLIPSLHNIDIKIFRKDIINFQIGNQDNKLKQSYAYQHTVEHNFLKNYCVSIGLGGTFTYVENLSNNLEIHVNLGFKAEF